MIFNDFINNICEDMQKQIQMCNNKMLMQDIIMIYNGCYHNYEDYKNTIIKGNNRVDEWNKNTLSYTYHPKHIILERSLLQDLLFRISV